MEKLTEVFERFRAAHLKLSPKKYHLFQKEVQFLGHIVSEHGVSTDPTKIAAVKEWPVPTDDSSVRSFMGLCTYYRRYVRQFATIAAPLHNLTRTGQKFLWNEECKTAFMQLKNALVSAPVLAFPDPSKPYILDCDASNFGVGGVLSQETDGLEHVVAYYSQSLSDPERNYCVTRKELLAVVKSLNHFHSYLYGAKFKVRSDHAALRWLKTLRKPEGQLARWLGKIEQYDYSIEYRPGRVHGNADSLSRRPCDANCKHCTKRDNSQELCRRTTVDAEMGDDDLAKEKRKDADLAPIMEQMKECLVKPPWEKISATSPVAIGYWSQWDLLRLRDGVLERKWEKTDGGGHFWQAVLPKKQRADVMKEVHNNLTGGHLGVKKTLSHLRQRFYWMGMRHDVEEWCRSCEVCCAKKGPKRQGRAPMELYQVGALMERVAVDIAGPLPVTASGNKYICVAMDYFTKWPEAYAIPDQEAATMARVLVDNYFCRFGMPM